MCLYADDTVDYVYADDIVDYAFYADDIQWSICLYADDVE